ncbi:MAG: hypothetical protein KBF75_12015 [Saprospiraceae bacterium]|mgnify:CR=1 FL=1|jgi:hypothetical protein|nr:hypothetical protein [Saprospiraceae bacterium]MCA0333112.1 hypothetical protein [Bacteroidota bacterium]MCB0605904.1 hypothetical protein [Saprospiraceae bacterium]MCB0753198.1 hypothetical protein [Ignavibacteriota bacterium]
MGFFTSDRLSERKTGKDIIAQLKTKNNKTLIIHYSCESFFNLNGRTPRVTSICVKNRGNNTTKTFSIHIQAQIAKKELCCITDEEYDYIEKQMLKSFFVFLKAHSTHYWVHWNMRNASYGFEAISNRYRILGEHPKDIESQFKVDLPEVLGKVYTYNFEYHKPDGQLLNLSKRNKISTRDALKGKEEAEAFDNRDFLKLHMSTSRKVEIIDRILTLEEKEKLKVKASFFKIYGISPMGIFEMIRNNWILFLIWSVVIYLIGSAFEPIVQKYFGTN